MSTANPEDVKDISRILSALGDIESVKGVVPPRVTQPPPVREAMVKVYDEFGSYDEVPASMFGTGPMEYNENDILAPVPLPKASTQFADPFENEYIENNSRPTQAQVPAHANVHKVLAGKEWVLKDTQSDEFKKAKIYSICSAYSGKPVIDGIMMYESAATIMNLLNSGKVISDPKVLGIISSGLLYSSVLKEGLNLAKTRQDALNKKDYQAAMELDASIDAKKNEANELRESVIQYLRDEGYIE